MQARTGIYRIKCVVSGKLYIGSSASIHSRWSQHRCHLRAGTHTSPRLQRAWIKHGEKNFEFSVLEECERKDLFAREQCWIDTLRPDYNSMLRVRVLSKEMLAKRKAAQMARAAAITHCPLNHEYSVANTYVNAKGKRICRACNVLRVSLRRSREKPEQRSARLSQMRSYHRRTRSAAA